MAAPAHFVFDAGDHGEWAVERVIDVIGEGLPMAARLSMGPAAAVTARAVWCLRGFTSNIRYATGIELGQLAAATPPLGRPASTRAALIPIRKSDAWWALGQDERRAIMEERSGHVSRSLRHLPAVARKLFHSRDLGEPFDFLTWFEYPPDYADAFEGLVADLRASEEWRYVDREVDVRLARAG